LRNNHIAQDPRSLPWQAPSPEPANLSGSCRMNPGIRIIIKIR
jgi:hypothetical protein